MLLIFWLKTCVIFWIFYAIDYLFLSESCPCPLGDLKPLIWFSLGWFYLPPDPILGTPLGMLLLLAKELSDCWEPAGCIRPGDEGMIFKKCSFYWLLLIWFFNKWVLPVTVFKLDVDPKFFLDDGGIMFGLPCVPFAICFVLLSCFVLLFPGIIFILVWSPKFGLNYLSPRVLVIWSFTDRFFVSVCWVLLLGVFYLSFILRPLLVLP